MEIVTIKWDETIPIRHKVLWPNKPALFCKVDGDESARHYGVKVQNELVCVASIYLDLGNARLRKFATLDQYQNQGIGTALLKHILEDSKSLNVHRFWFDARESAVDFYKKFGFSIEGSRFYKSEVAYFKMAKGIVA
jgi:GNAT superfamily N-acetyltransferase